MIIPTRVFGHGDGGGMKSGLSESGGMESRSILKFGVPDP